MPKKFVGENSKAVAAKARKAAAQEEQAIRKQKQIEDEYWKDDDKNLAKKQARKEEQERKKMELLKKKAETKALMEEEVSSIKTAGKQPISKITRAQIVAETERRNQAATGNCQKAPETHIEQPLEENINRLQIEGDEARTVDEAISILSSKDAEVDKHPEKRLKAAYAAFEEVAMPRIKEENPTLRLSQLKQILRKEWMKSPENPLNQRQA
ncbi:LOW QUALITY PROTEIN: coiled-coil domain-containing protein 124-like [Homalodisca vitripennis]|uniref:LOW QUALITY PROTEIN: coiled-coil domain-containing protein 124-like n=1 Tax=Homalodisca vitripennis TaxID=197043 RepID=UPI001EEA05AE|nr:LOW QUALITY PROTEIN: coiled-coil domain-containing protein 124-like [Homalodisca vitripennis]